MEKKDVPIFITTTETSELSKYYGFMGAYGAAERGGIALVIPPLTQGLTEVLGYKNVHVIIPNLKKVFDRNKGRTDKSELENRLHIQERYIHFIESDHIRNLAHIYAEDCPGGHERTLAIYQARAAALIKDNLGFYGRKGIHISNDGTGGYLNAFLKTREVPTLHMMHSVHGRNIPLAEYKTADTPTSDYQHNFFLQRGDHSRLAVTETSIKNARFVGVVGDQFKKELLSGTLDKFFESDDVLNELKIKEEHGQLKALPNGFHPKLLPENQHSIFDSKEFKEAGATNDRRGKTLVQLKNENLRAFQKLTRESRKKDWSPGLDDNEDAVLSFWPSRLDDFQKGAQYIAQSAVDLLRKHKNAQIAIIADESGDRGIYTELMKRLSAHFPGQFYYSEFEKKFSDFGFSAASSILSAPSFEPFGYYVLQGLATGAPIIGTKSGGLVDMLKEYNPLFRYGNGFFIGGDEASRQEEFTKTLHKAHTTLSAVKSSKGKYNSELRRLMINVRKNHGVEAMMERYAPVIDTMVTEVGGRNPRGYFGSFKDEFISFN